MSSKEVVVLEKEEFEAFFELVKDAVKLLERYRRAQQLTKARWFAEEGER